MQKYYTCYYEYASKKPQIILCLTNLLSTFYSLFLDSKKSPKSRRFNIRSIQPSSTLSSFLKERDSKSSKVLEVTPVRTI